MSQGSTLSALAQSTERQRALNLLEEMPARGLHRKILHLSIKWTLNNHFCG